MSQTRLQELLSACCALIHGEHAPESIEQGLLEVDGITFALRSAGGEDCDDVLVHCDFGPMRNAPEPAHGDLLRANLTLYGGSQGSSFALDPRNGHVLLLSHIRLGQTSAEVLALRLHVLAQLATMWAGDTRALASYFESGGENARESSPCR